MPLATARSLPASTVAALPKLAPGTVGLLQSGGLTLASCVVAPDAPDRVRWCFRGGLPTQAFTLELGPVDVLPELPFTHSVPNGAFRATAWRDHTEAGNHLFVTNTGTEVLFVHFLDADHHRWGTTNARPVLRPGTYHFARVHSLTGHFHGCVDRPE